MSSVPLTRVEDSSTRVSGWTLAIIAFAIAVAVLLVGYWHTAHSLTSAWAHDGTYQYAFLIFPISAWLAFGLRDPLRANPPVPSFLGLLAVAGLAFIWYVGRLLDINLAQHFAFVAMFPALVLACWGWRALWVLVFPLAYLVVFAVPWGNAMVGPLQDITARFAVHALELTGTPVLLEGREIVTPEATWMVEEACSGVKFFMACAALGSLFAYLMYTRWWKRALFVVLAAVVPIIANGLRVYFTVLIGETFGMHYATGTDHMIFGWQFFGTVLALLLLAGWFFRDPPPARKHLRVDRTMPGRFRSLIWPATIVLLVAAPVLAAGMAAPTPVATLDVSAPAVTGWQGPAPASGDWQPSFKGPAGQTHVAYQPAAGGAGVELYHAIYTGKPRAGHTLITYGNDVYDPESMRPLGSEGLQVQLGSGRTTDAREVWLNSPSGARLVWYWYCVDDRCTSSPIEIKVLQAIDVLRGHSPQSSVWAMSTPITSHGKDDARVRLRAFAHALTLNGTGNPSRPVPDATGGQP